MDFTDDWKMSIWTLVSGEFDQSFLFSILFKWLFPILHAGLLSLRIRSESVRI
jgi:hypothetical protein